MDSTKQVCFDRTELKFYLFILICLLVYFVFILWKYKETMSDVNLNRGLSQNDLEKKINKLQDELYNCNIAKDKCDNDLIYMKSMFKDNSTQKLFLDKIYNPLHPPENIYSSGRINMPGYDSYQQYQMIGYLSGNGQQYPVYARDKYPGRTDKQEYYTINDSRNRIKIPFKYRNWDELFDGDTIDIPEIGNNLIFRKYETNQLRYDPRVY